MTQGEIREYLRIKSAGVCRIGIVGSRKFEQHDLIKNFLHTADIDIYAIVSGGCPNGADNFAKHYALEYGFKYVEFPPAHQEWNEYCILPEKCYGKKYHVGNFGNRNEQIVIYSHIVLAFLPLAPYYSSGTEDTLRQCARLGTAHLRIREAESL